MEREIIDSIYHLFRSRLVTTIIDLTLVIVAMIIVVLVVKFKIVEPITHRVLLIVFISILSIVLLSMQFCNIHSIYKDYQGLSYNVLHNAKMVLRTPPGGVIDRENEVTVIDSAGTQYVFKMESDYNLELGVEYVGTVAYLEHSNYVIWYCFD